jgi:flavodoxin I
MAKAVVEGVKSLPNVTFELSYHIDASDLTNYDAIIVGAPTYRAQMPIDFKNLFEEVESKNINLRNKVGSAFGSFGWSGEAPQAVIEMLRKEGMQVVEPPVRAKLSPDQKALDDCVYLGKIVAQKAGNTS